MTTIDVAELLNCPHTADVHRLLRAAFENRDYEDIHDAIELYYNHATANREMVRPRLWSFVPPFVSNIYIPRVHAGVDIVDWIQNFSTYRKAAGRAGPDDWDEFVKIIAQQSRHGLRDALAVVDSIVSAT